MMENPASYRSYCGNDSAASSDYGNVSDKEINANGIAILGDLTQHPIDGMIEAVPAYSSVSVYFDIAAIRKKIPSHKKTYEWIINKLTEVMVHDFTGFASTPGLVRIPVCYYS